MSAEYSTPVNTLKRETLTILITNNIMNNSVDFESDSETMQTDSPLGKPIMQLVSKKLFHSPMGEHPSEVRSYSRLPLQQKRQTMKRKHALIPDSAEKIKKVFVSECDTDSRCVARGEIVGRQKILLSLFHNREYCMDIDG